MSIETLLKELKSSPDIILYPAATQQQIQVFEEITGLELPLDLKALYSYSNGFEGIKDLFRIIPLEEILDWPSRSQLTFNQFNFAEFLIYADVWYIEINASCDAPYTIFYLTPEEKEEKVPLTNSLTEFISCFLMGGMYDKKGVYDWMKSVAPRLRLFL
jgi:hypothetical protein